MIALALVLAAAPAGLSDEEMERALAGEIPVRAEPFTTSGGKGAGRGLGAIVIERPVADVWATIAHYDDKHEYIPRLDAVTVHERRPDAVRVTMVVDATLKTVRYTAWYHLDEAAHVIRWELDRRAPDNGIADTEGEWRMVALTPSRTLVVYRSYVDTGAMVPGFVQKYMSVRSIPDLLSAVKKRIESGRTWKKD